MTKKVTKKDKELRKKSIHLNDFLTVLQKVNRNYAKALQELARK